jgi:hypothetical protein
MRADVGELGRTGLVSPLVTFSYGSDGWVSFPLDHPDASGGLHVRIRNRDGRLIITELFLHAPEITPEMVRGISISRLQAAVSLAGASRSVSDTAPAEDSAARAPQVLARTTADVTAAVLVTASVTPGVADDDAPDPTLAQIRARTPRNVPPETPSPERPRLTRPDGAAPEEFYPRVAAAYAQYAPRTRAPAKQIAAEAGVPVTTAHRWIREARRRGYLPPATKGKAG